MSIHEKMLCTVVLEDTMKEAALILAQSELIGEPIPELGAEPQRSGDFIAPAWDDGVLAIWMKNPKGWG